MKMSKSGQTEPNMGELSLESKLKAMESEKNYWETRHRLREKYGDVEQREPSGMTPPQFVWMGGCSAVRLSNDGKYYYRDAGCWGCGFEYRDGDWYSVSDINPINENLMTPCTEDEWMNDNKGYIDGYKKGTYDSINDGDDGVDGYREQDEDIPF